MTCVHKVRWSVKRPENCRFRLSVSHYKDRIVAPDEYSGATVVTPSDSEQVLATKDKTVRANITVNPAPVESLATSENGTFLPSSGNVGFSEVVVDVEPSLESLSVTENGLYLPESGVDGFDRVSVSVPIPTFQTEEKTINANGVFYPSAGKDGISKVTVNVPSQAPVLDSMSVTQNGTYTPASGVDGFDEVVVNVPVSDWSAPVLVYEGDFSAVTSAFSVTELPNGDPFSFDKIIVELSHVQQGQNVNKRTYWRSDMPTTGYNEPLLLDGGSSYRYNIMYHAVTTITIEDDTYIGLVAVSYDEANPTSTSAVYQRKAHGGYDKITAYAWWAWNCPAGAHIKIMGYNRTS